MVALPPTVSMVLMQRVAAAAARRKMRLYIGRNDFFIVKSIVGQHMVEVNSTNCKTRKNRGKRFVTCSKCNVYDFLDDDLPSEYYKELLYGMFQTQKQSKKHMDYEQVINVLAMEKSMCEEELRATKSKLKLYDRLFFITLGTFSVVCVGFGMLVGK
ncbi:hypothetical protein Tco_0133705 [Tanacetum coccineum]